ncbi:unnamed protein product [Dicrocoelium dendriticum]|nr:unnamed protein product [Dicrocoelium dendriticum]
MAHRASVYAYRKILPSPLSQEKRGRYSEEDLYDDKYDAEEQEQPEAQHPALPPNLPRIAPTISLSVRPAVAIEPRTSGSSDNTPAIHSLVTASSATPVHTAVSSRVGSFSGHKRGSPGEVLTWQSGRLESILLRTESSPARPPVHILPLRPALGKRNSIQRPTASSPSLFPIGAKQVRGRPRGRPRKNCGPANYATVDRMEATNENEEREPATEAHADVLLPPPPVISSTFVPRPPPKRPEPKSKNESILLPLWEYHPPTKNSLPVLDLMVKSDPLAAIESDKSNIGPSAPGSVPSESAGHSQTPGGPPGAHNSQSMVTGRMKSSSNVGELNPQELKNYRRLSGYTLFVLVNKRKYGALAGGALSVDDVNELGEPNAAGPKDANRKWQAIWSTLPEKVRKQWKTKAKRLLKQSEQQVKHGTWDKDRLSRDRRRLEGQLARSEVTSTGLLDLAAHFQLLSDSFAAYEKQLSGYEGLKVGDLIIKFDSVTASNFRGLQDIASVNQNAAPLSAIRVDLVRPSMANQMFHLRILKPAGGTSLGMHVSVLR